MDPNVQHSFQMHFGAKQRKNTVGRIALGVFLVVLGGGWLLDSFQMIEFWPFVHLWWPSALMILAVVKLVVGSGSTFGSAVLFLIGALIQLGKFDVIDGFWGALWPIVIILAGISILVDRKKKSYLCGINVPMDGSKDGADDLNRVEATAIFGASEQRITSKGITGGELTAIFGGLEIDLRGAEIEGDIAVIKCEVVFGGVEIMVPPHWIVHIKGTPILGGIENKTGRYRDPNLKGPTLVLVSTVVFGGLEIST